MTEAYTPKRFFDEIRGIADGSGVDYTTLYRIHMFPEVRVSFALPRRVWPL
jgi:hypothetical protein